MTLHERDVLVGGGVEDQLRALLVEDALQPTGVLHVRDDDLEAIIIQPVRQMEEARLPPIQGHDRVDTQAEQVLHQPGSDRAGHAGDQGPSTFDHVPRVEHVVLDRLAPDQLQDVDVGQVADADRLTADRLVRARSMPCRPVCSSPARNSRSLAASIVGIAKYTESTA